MSEDPTQSEARGRNRGLQGPPAPSTVEMGVRMVVCLGVNAVAAVLMAVSLPGSFGGGPAGGIGTEMMMRFPFFVPLLRGMYAWYKLASEDSSKRRELCESIEAAKCDALSVVFSFGLLLSSVLVAFAPRVIATLPASSGFSWMFLQWALGMAMLGRTLELAFLPLLASGLWRDSPGVCRQCGYSRAGLDDTMPCPECAAAYERPPQATATQPPATRKLVMYSGINIALVGLAAVFHVAQLPLLSHPEHTGLMLGCLGLMLLLGASTAIGVHVRRRLGYAITGGA